MNLAYRKVACHFPTTSTGYRLPFDGKFKKKIVCSNLATGDGKIGENAILFVLVSLVGLETLNRNEAERQNN